MKNRYTPAYPSFFYTEVGFKGYILHRSVFLMNGTAASLPTEGHTIWRFIFLYLKNV